jgi:hypothetical protein
MVKRPLAVPLVDALLDVVRAIGLAGNQIGKGLLETGGETAGLVALNRC